MQSFVIQLIEGLKIEIAKQALSKNNVDHGCTQGKVGQDRVKNYSFTCFGINLPFMRFLKEMNNGSGKSSILKKPLSVNSASRIFNSPEAQSDRTQTVM